MANQKISARTLATLPLTGSEKIPIGVSGDKAITPDMIRNYIGVIAWSDWDASTNTTPTDPQLGTFYQATDDSTILLKSDGQPVDAGDVLTPKVANPGTDITDKTKWAILKATWGTYSAIPLVLTLEINP